MTRQTPPSPTPRDAAIEVLRSRGPIGLVVCDVDGVMTDGRVGLLPDGSVMRSFNMKDGMGVKILKEAGVRVGWCSAGVDDGVVRRRGEHVGVDDIDVAPGDKGDRFLAMCGRLGVEPARTLYIGDDINDLPPMEHAGLSVCPSDAVDAVRCAVDLVLHRRGGDACFRELVELIVEAKRT